MAQAELKNEIRRVQQQLSDTQTALGRIEVQDAEYRKRNEKLMLQFEATESHKVELLLKVQDADDAIAKLRAQLEETNRRSTDFQSRLAALQEEKSSTESQLHEARGLLQSTSIRFAAAEEQVAVLEQKVSHQGSLEAKIKAQYGIIEGKTKEVDTLQRECNELRDRATSADASVAVRRTLEETLERSRRSFEQSDSERLRLASLNETLERRISNLEGDVVGKEKETRRLQDTILHDKARYDSLMEELQVLQRKLTSKASLDGKFEAMQGICDQQREELRKLRQQLADVHDRESQEKAAQDQARELTFEVRQLRVQLESKGAAIAELEGEVEKKVAHIHRLRRDMQDKDAQYAQAQEQVQEAKRETARATREWESLQERQRTKRASSVEATHRHQRDADVAATTQITLEESLRSSEQRYGALQSKASQLEDLVAQLRAQLRDAETGKAKVEMDLDLLRASLHQSKDSQERALQESTSLRQECVQLVASLREKEKSMVHLQAVHSRELQSRDDDITALAKMIDDIKHHAVHNVAKHHDHEEQQTTMSIELRLLEDTNKQLRDDVGALHSEIRHLRSTSRSPHVVDATQDVRLRAELEQAELRLADEQRRHRSLQQQHDELLRSVDAVKRAFAQREATLEADLREANRQRHLVNEEQRQIAQRRGR
jgi:chromosome segregation ATPase